MIPEGGQRRGGHQGGRGQGVVRGRPRAALGAAGNLHRRRRRHGRSCFVNLRDIGSETAGPRCERHCASPAAHRAQPVRAASSELFHPERRAELRPVRPRAQPRRGQLRVGRARQTLSRPRRRHRRVLASATRTRRSPRRWSSSRSKLVHVSNLYYHEPQGRLAAGAGATRSAPGKVFFCQQRRRGQRRSVQAGAQVRPRRRPVRDPHRAQFLPRPHAGGHRRHRPGQGEEGFRADGRRASGTCPSTIWRPCATAISPATVAILIEGVQGEGGVTPATPGIPARPAAVVRREEAAAVHGRRAMRTFPDRPVPEFPADPRRTCRAAKSFCRTAFRWRSRSAAVFPSARSGCGRRMRTCSGRARTPRPSAARRWPARWRSRCSKSSSANNWRTTPANSANGSRAACRRLANKYPSMLQEARGLGLMIGVELAPDIDETARRSCQAAIHPVRQPVARGGRHGDSGWPECVPAVAGVEPVAQRGRGNPGHLGSSGEEAGLSHDQGGAQAPGRGGSCHAPVQSSRSVRANWRRRHDARPSRRSCRRWRTSSSTARRPNTILARFKKLFPGRRFPRPEDLASVTDDAIRAAGFSCAKMASIRDIAAKTLDGVVPTSRQIVKLSDDEIVGTTHGSARGGPLDGGDAVDFPTGPAGRVAGGRFRRAHRFPAGVLGGASCPRRRRCWRTVNAGGRIRTTASWYLCGAARWTWLKKSGVTAADSFAVSNVLCHFYRRAELMKHLLSIGETDQGGDGEAGGDAAVVEARARPAHGAALAGQTWALIFSKSSTRTRVSFEVGIRELGGRRRCFSARTTSSSAAANRSRTPPACWAGWSTARSSAPSRRSDVEEFAQFSGIPTINALTDERASLPDSGGHFHVPGKARPDGRGKVVTFIGDGACNVANSWIFAAAKLGFELRIAAPKKFQPAAALLKRAGGKMSRHGRHPGRGRRRGRALHRRVGFDGQGSGIRPSASRSLTGYQINQSLVKLAKPDALVMHCLPAYRGKEIDDATLRGPRADTIFDQAENRLHVQKAMLNWVVS